MSGPTPHYVDGESEAQVGKVLSMLMQVMGELGLVVSQHHVAFTRLLEQDLTCPVLSSGLEEPVFWKIALCQQAQRGTDTPVEGLSYEGGVW